MSADLSPAEIDILIRQNSAPNGGGTLEGLALTQLCAEIARLREALRFYAYPGTYTGRPTEEEMRTTARALLGPREARALEK